MRSFEPFNGPFFVQPLTTDQREPLSITHSWETDEGRFSRLTFVFRLWPFKAGLAFGRWSPGPHPDEIKAANIREAERSEYARFVAVNGPTYWPSWWKAYDDARDLGLDDEARMEFVQQAVIGG